MNEDKKLTREQIQQFRDNGVLLLPSFYDSKLVESIQHAIYQIIGRVMHRHRVADTRRPFSPQFFDDGFNELILLDRSYGAEVYDAVKQIPAFIRLLASADHEVLMHQLRENCIPAIAAQGYGIRIDNPNEDHFRAMWHQEYPAQLRSLNGVVFWSSLVPITPELGPVDFCLGSHKGGPIPVTTKSGDKLRKGAYTLKLANEEKELAKYRIENYLSGPTDLIVVDFLTIHASGFNRSRRSRWSMQFRYFDFNDPVGTAHGWKGSFASGVDFTTIHPELCVDLEKQETM